MAQAVVRRGSVVLIRYPFTDLIGAKVRPALVLTPDLLPLAWMTCSVSSSLLRCRRSFSLQILCWKQHIRHFRPRG